MEDIETGAESSFTYTVTDAETIPNLYPDSDYFQEMPEVFATGYLVGLVEWACIDFLDAYLDWPEEQTVGTNVDLDHEAPTPPGVDVTVHTEVTDVDGRLISFDVHVEDEVERIGTATHTRFVVDRDQFVESAESKRS